MLHGVFQKLGLSDQEMTAYLTLLESGATSAGTLAKRLGRPRATTYDCLDALLARGLVTQKERDGKKLWVAQSADNLEALIGREQKEWESLHRSFAELLPKLKAKTRTDFVPPRFSYFEGIDGVKHILNDLLLYRSVPTLAFWPGRDMLELLGEEFFNRINVERLKQQISVRAIWPQDKLVDIGRYQCFGVGKPFLREIRLAPAELDWSMGYWAYKNKVAFISSRKECFGFIVESHELFQMLEAQFEMIWRVSTPLQVPLEKTRKFLQQLA